MKSKLKRVMLLRFGFVIPCFLIKSSIRIFPIFSSLFKLFLISHVEAIVKLLECYQRFAFFSDLVLKCYFSRITIFFLKFALKPGMVKGGGWCAPWKKNTQTQY